MYNMKLFIILQYLYAFSVTPLKQMDHKDLIQQPEAVTDCPYKEILKSKVYYMHVHTYLFKLVTGVYVHVHVHVLTTVVR